MRRAVTVLCLAIVGLVTAADLVSAQGGGDYLDGDGGQVDGGAEATDTGGVVTVGAVTGPGEDGPGGGQSPCTVLVGEAAQVQAVIEGMLPGAPAAEDPLEGADPEVTERPWVLVRCSDVGGAGIVDLFQVGDPPPATIMAEAARRALVLPLPAASLSPPEDAFQVTGVATWFWIDDTQTVPVTATACLEPADWACASVVATFVELHADPGDGSPTIDCDGPGIAWDPALSVEAQRDLPYCGHLYLEPTDDGARHPATVTSVWSLTWSCAYDADGDGVRESGCGGGALDGALGRRGAPLDVEVREYQAVATG